MKLSIIIGLLLAFTWTLSSQDQKTSIVEVKRDINFLASDELEGRELGDQGSNVAARYIAESFRFNGLISPEGVDDFYQNIVFEKRAPAESGTITTRDTQLVHKDGTLYLTGNEGNFTAPLVFVDQGWVDDTLNHYDGIEVDGKIVLALFGVPGSQDPREGFGAIRQKRKWASERGAVGMIEIYTGGYPWGVLKNFLLRETLVPATGEETIDLTYALANYKFTNELSLMADGETVEAVMETSGLAVDEILSPNVIGWLEGADPSMKDEYVVVSAHYDHVGMNEGSDAEDIIYNGARDNAIGVTAVLRAAEYFSDNRPNRSVLFIAYTGEEKGLLGSAYYAENPVLPLKNAIFNMNSDGAGYNDTTLVTIIGLDRVGVTEILAEAAASQGLTAINDPAPEQGLFDRSDNVNLAKKGIPAPTFAPGMSAFDQEIMKNYHQVTDNPETLNYNYVTKFVNAFIIATENIANLAERPVWKTGDKYEEAYKSLMNTP